MTHVIMQSECTVEEGPMVADLTQVKYAGSIESLWEFCLNKGEDQLSKGIIGQRDVTKDAVSYCNFYSSKICRGCECL